MKTRIIQTKIWSDSLFARFNRLEKLAFIYLISNPFIGMSGCYELSDKQACFDLDCSQSEWENTKKTLESLGRVFFVDGWVRIANAGKYQDFTSGNANQIKAHNDELSRVPVGLLEKDIQLVPNQSPTSPRLDNNSNSNNINNNKKGGVGENKNSKNSHTPCTHQELLEVAKELRVPIASVTSVHSSILDLIKAKEFKHKTVYYTLRNWLRMRIEKGTLQVYTNQTYGSNPIPFDPLAD